MALLPTLDPTTMGWRERRGFHLDPVHVPYLFDRAGNGGTTVWVDGRIVGCWVQGDDERVEPILMEDISADARRLLDVEVARLDEFLARRPHHQRVRLPADEAPTSQLNRQRNGRGTEHAPGIKFACGGADPTRSGHCRAGVAARPDRRRRGRRRDLRPPPATRVDPPRATPAPRHRAVRRPPRVHRDVRGARRRDPHRAHERAVASTRRDHRRPPRPRRQAHGRFGDGGVGHRRHRRTRRRPGGPRRARAAGGGPRDVGRRVARAWRRASGSTPGRRSSARSDPVGS